VLTYIGSFICAALVAAFLTPLATKLGRIIRAVDHPGEARKIHTRPIPRIGGVAVVIAFFAPLVGLAIYTNRISGLVYEDLRLMGALVAGTAGIVGLGIYDDIRGADAKLKLVVQTAVAVVMWLAGFRIELFSNPFGEAITINWLSLPLTVFWIVGVINALNLIDGLDGLATGVALMAVVVLFGVSYIENVVLLCTLLAALAGSLAGFLIFNFNPAKIFLGDSGSMFLGFVLASISVWTQRKGATAAAVLIPVMALGLPLLDTALSVVRRVARGSSPFKADREHLHHKLLALGLSHKGAVLTLYTVSGVFALGALALLDNDTTRRAITLSTIAAVVFILVRRVGIVGAPAVLKPSLQPTGNRRDVVRAACREIRGAASQELVWAELTKLAPAMGWEEVKLSWVEDGQREIVYRWKPPGRESQAEDWRLDRGLSPYDRARRFSLAEGESSYGDLQLLLGKPQHPIPPDDELCLELVREALIDARVHRASPVAEGRVVVLAPARSRPGEASR
jgi:UDP-GlcNAc:undecaprenyl-phosphate GlcNAc-1-phosphate transferase